MHLNKPGPWIWVREKYEPDGQWFCTLKSNAPIEEVSCRDRMVLPMREDCAQFSYAGTLPEHILIEKAPDLLAMVGTLLEICRWKCGPDDEVVLSSGESSHDALIRACALIEEITG